MERINLSVLDFKIVNIFLSVFNLHLSNTNISNHFINILDCNDNLMGYISLNKGKYSIYSETKWGLLKATFKINNNERFDSEYISKTFEFSVNEKLNFCGNILVNINVKNINDYELKTSIKYNKGLININHNNKLFVYNGAKKDLSIRLFEIIEVNPFTENGNYIYHSITTIDEQKRNINQKESYICKNSFIDAKNLRCVSIEQDNSYIKNYKSNTFNELDKNDIVKSATQKVFLMKNIDYSFYAKINEILKDFELNGESYLSSLFNITLHNINSDQKGRLFIEEEKPIIKSLKNNK